MEGLTVGREWSDLEPYIKFKGTVRVIVSAATEWVCGLGFFAYVGGFSVGARER